MKILKFKSLNLSFIFIVCDMQMTPPPPRDSLEYDDYAFLLLGIGSDLSFVYRGENIARLIYFISLYLSGVIKLPRGEYDVNINGRKYTISNELDGLFCSGNYGKCKTLLSNSVLTVNTVDMLYSVISYEGQIYCVMNCPVLSGLDMPNIAPSFIRALSNGTNTRVLAVSAQDSICELMLYYGGAVAVPSDIELLVAAHFLGGSYSFLSPNAFVLYNGYGMHISSNCLSVFRLEL